ncbi:MAG: hypothetical protein HYX76_02345 [Acidobacteria bacterium]|nr:hypothetical protein [Acidobacteriota bacterium]
MSLVTMDSTARDLEPPASRARGPSCATLDGLVVLDANFTWTRALFSPIASRVPVLFLEPRDLVTAWQAGWRLTTGYGRREIETNLEGKRYVFPPGWFSRYHSPFRYYLASEIRRWVRRRALRRFGLIVTYPHYAAAVPRCGPAASAYYWSDEFRHYWPWHRDRIVELERQAVRITDLTICASNVKAEELRAEVPDVAEKIHVLIHGFHPSLLVPEPLAQPKPMPADLQHIPRPILGYWGHVSDHLDFRIAFEVATALPSASMVFIGHMADHLGDQQEWYERCRALANVHFVGRRPYEAIADYVPSFDVCLSLYRSRHPFTRLTNPSKIRDYMATSRPIVSTALPDVRRYWSDLIRVAGSSDEFVAEVRALLAGNDPTSAARLAFAREHTWEKAAARIWDRLNTVVAA